MRYGWREVLGSALLLLALNAPRALAQQNPEAEIAGLPDWLILEKGRVEAERKEYGRALYFCRAAIASRGGRAYPEAEELIGDVYRADNELRLAEKQYRKAIETGSSMEAPEERYQVMYKLADMFLEQERYNDFRIQLQAVAAENASYSDPRLSGMRDSMNRLYREQGFDPVMRYYRVDAPFAARAHADLGWFFYRTGLFKEGSIPHSLFAADIVLGRAVEELRLADPEYQYRNLEGFVELALARENTRSFLQESGFFRTLYYLACASKSSGEMARQARELWSLLSRTPAAGKYAGIAARQLAAPWEEPRINPSIRDIDQAAGAAGNP